MVVVVDVVFVFVVVVIVVVVDKVVGVHDVTAGCAFDGVHEVVVDVVVAVVGIIILEKIVIKRLVL